MSILKNKRRVSKIEYERTYIGLYEYMTNMVDHLPKRWQEPLGRPIKEELNDIYDMVARISDMYLEGGNAKARYVLCGETIRKLEGLKEWLYLYWNMSDGKNGIHHVGEDKRKFMAAYINKEMTLLAGVMAATGGKWKHGPFEAEYMQSFSRHDIEKTVFLGKLYELNNLVYRKSIRIPLAQRDEEVFLARKYIRNAFYCAYTANRINPRTKSRYEKRKRLLAEAISDMYRLDRPMLKLFMAGMFSRDDEVKIASLINESTKLMQAVQNTDKERFSSL